MFEDAAEDAANSGLSLLGTTLIGKIIFILLFAGVLAGAVYFDQRGQLGGKEIVSVGGADRVATAIAVARQWERADTVVLAPGENAKLMESVAALPLAGQENAPVLFSWDGTLSDSTLREIERLNARKALAVGDLGEEALARLRGDFLNMEIVRLRGQDKWDTTAQINALMRDPQGMFLVGADALADALSAASFAAANRYMIVLADEDGGYRGGVSLDGYILGTEALVRDQGGLIRVAGSDRYETNRALLEILTPKSKTVYAVNGESLVDAFAGSVLAAKTNSPVYLLPKMKVTDLAPAVAYASSIHVIGSSDLEGTGAALLDLAVLAGQGIKRVKLWLLIGLGVINIAGIFVIYWKILREKELAEEWGDIAFGLLITLDVIVLGIIIDARYLALSMILWGKRFFWEVALLTALTETALLLQRLRVTKTRRALLFAGLIALFVSGLWLDLFPLQAAMIVLCMISFLRWPCPVAPFKYILLAASLCFMLWANGVGSNLMLYLVNVYFMGLTAEIFLLLLVASIILLRPAPRAIRR